MFLCKRESECLKCIAVCHGSSSHTELIEVFQREILVFPFKQSKEDWFVFLLYLLMVEESRFCIGS